MEWTNVGQLYQLLLSAGFGFVLGICYELFRFVRRLMSSRTMSVIGQDIVFFTVASGATYLFDLYLTGGMLRWYLFVGLATGFWVYYVTVGRLLFAVFGWIAERLRRLFAMTKMATFRLMAMLSQSVSPYKRQIIKKYQQLRDFFSKKVLKRKEEVLYNQEE